MTDLDLSEWIEMCLHFKSVKIYTGPHAEEFIDGVREYEERIRKLEAKLSESEALLAKTVDNIENLIIAIAMGWDLEGVVAEARTTLAELKGQDDE